MTFIQNAVVDFLVYYYSSLLLLKREWELYTSEEFRIQKLSLMSKMKKNQEINEYFKGSLIPFIASKEELLLHTRLFQ